MHVYIINNPRLQFIYDINTYKHMHFIYHSSVNIV